MLPLKQQTNKTETPQIKEESLPKKKTLKETLEEAKKLLIEKGKEVLDKPKTVRGIGAIDTAMNSSKKYVKGGQV